MGQPPTKENYLSVFFFAMLSDQASLTRKEILPSGQDDKRIRKTVTFVKFLLTDNC